MPFHERVECCISLDVGLACAPGAQRLALQRQHSQPGSAAGKAGDAPASASATGAKSLDCS